MTSLARCQTKPWSHGQPMLRKANLVMPSILRGCDTAGTFLVLVCTNPPNPLLSRRWVMVGWHIQGSQPQPPHSCPTKASLRTRPLQRSSEKGVGVRTASSLCPFPSAGASTAPRPLPVPPRVLGALRAGLGSIAFFFLNGFSS